MDFKQQLKTGRDYLLKNDKVLVPVIEKYGLPSIKPHLGYYETLVGSIISQQLNVQVAAIIQERFVNLFGHFPTPEEILETEIDELKSVGLSGRKAEYIQDLALKTTEKLIDFKNVGKLSKEEISEQLIQVKGIGEWTIHMFLIFCLGRLDVLAVGDLGIRNAAAKLYNLKSKVKPEDIQELARKNHWHPYESMVCWYLWRSLENKPNV